MTHHVSRITFHASRITFHASRFTHHVSRFILHPQEVMMPRLSQLMIRTALVWLALGSTIGGLMLLNKGFPLLPWLWTLRYTHVHLVLVGWMVQLACGVAFWILPRLDAGGSRGDERLVWLCYGALNGGLVLAALHDPLRGVLDERARAMPLVAGVLYAAAVALFVAHAARRLVVS
jgi:hypothetical protein